MQQIQQLHDVMARAVLLVLILLAVWGIGAGLFKRSVGGTYRSTYVLAAGFIGLQDIVGLTMFIGGLRPSVMLHLLYGVVPLIVLIGAFTYSTDVSPRREAFTFGLASLFTLILVAVRTIPTGGH